MQLCAEFPAARCRPHGSVAWHFLLLALAVGAGLRAAELRPDVAKVAVAPTRTSIYVGWVSLTMPDFVRREGRFESNYAAKVFPYFFSNETGRLGIDFSDAQLERLAQGETVEFTGSAINHEQAPRRVEGKATPTDALHGKLKVRVFVSPKIELIFNTTYSFAPQSPAP
jgi:hypothetical protein